MKFYLTPSFFFMILFMAFIDNINNFFLIYLFVFIHELCHILTAKYFGLETQKIIFSGLGTNAKIIGLRFFTLPREKFYILISGSFFNFICWVIFKFIWQNDFLAGSNFLICVFNLLPIYPLDGGKIFLLFIKKIFGRTDIFFFMKINKILIAAISCLGFFNFYFYIVGAYLLYINKKLLYDMVLDLYFYNIDSEKI